MSTIDELARRLAMSHESYLVSVRGVLDSISVSRDVVLLNNSMKRMLDSQGSSISLLRDVIGTNSAVNQAASSLASIAASQSVLQSLTGRRAALDMAPEMDAYEAVLSSGFDVERISDILAQVLQQPALMIAEASAERLRKWTEYEQRLETAIRARGWWVPPSWNRSTLLQLGATAETSGRVAFRRAMVEWHSRGSSRVLSGMLKNWMSSPPFQRRRAVLQDGLQDHRSGRYRVTVPTLLPLLEGIAMEEFRPGSNETGLLRQLADAVGADEAHELVSNGVLMTVGILWAFQYFSEVSPTSRSLNRHRVLHGRSLRYGTAENSLRVFLALDQLAWAVDEHTKREASA